MDRGRTAGSRSAAQRGAAYLRRIRQRGVAPGDAAGEALQQFVEPLPTVPCDPALVLKQLDEVGSPARWRMREGASLVS